MVIDYFLKNFEVEVYRIEKNPETSQLLLNYLDIII